MSAEQHAERVREKYRAQGERRAAENLLAFLKDQGVIRDSMFGEGWLVVEAYPERLDLHQRRWFDAAKSSPETPTTLPLKENQE